MTRLAILALAAALSGKRPPVVRDDSQHNRSPSGKDRTKVKADRKQRHRSRRK